MSSKTCAAFLFFFCTLCFGQDPYPEVRPVERKFEVAAAEKADVALSIVSRRGKPVYKLQCHPAGYVGDPGFDYSGKPGDRRDVPRFWHRRVPRKNR
jgi:hypothetical protein